MTKSLPGVVLICEQLFAVFLFVAFRIKKQKANYDIALHYMKYFATYTLEF
jgi:hypothetical protein